MPDSKSKSTSSAKLPEPLVTNSQNKILHSLVSQLDESQYWPTEKLQQGQLQQLKNLIAYAIVYSPFYKERLKDIDPGNFSFEDFKKIPLLTRVEIQDHGQDLDCNQVPESHGKISETMTSGSTATPVSVRTTGLVSMVWNAINLREHLWHGRDVGSTMASIRWRPDAVGMAPKGVVFEDWGMPVNQFYKTSPGYYLNSSSEIQDQLKWLEEINPAYLMTHPSNLQALVEEAQRNNATLSSIKQVRTVGESVSDAQRKLLHADLGIDLVDFYSSQELGYVALQCPEQSHYHVQSESLIVEILREDGSDCHPFEPGKIVVTSLRNYATPLIRYEVGDYGEWGESCSCGRSLPVLNTINGRVRNMLQLPNGNRHWPNFGFRKIMDIAKLQQFQIVQHSLENLELKLVVLDEVDGTDEEEIKQVLQNHLGHPFQINISYHAELPRSASGKFEDFVSLINSP